MITGSQNIWVLETYTLKRQGQNSPSLIYSASLGRSLWADFLICEMGVIRPMSQSVMIKQTCVY